MNLLSIFSISFFQAFTPLAHLEILKTYPFSKQNIIFFKNLFFTSAVIEWNSLEHNIRKVGSFSVFKNNILKLLRPTPNSIFNCENHRGFKLIQDCVLVLVFCANTNSNLVFKIH